MPIKSIKDKSSIVFALSADVRQKLNTWRSAQDAMVFQEQVLTGEFRGKQKLSADVWLIVKEMHKAGEISPYYGASGGGYSYQLQITPDITTVHLYNSLTDEFFDVHEPSDIEIQTRISRRLRALLSTRSPVLVPEEWMLFRISGREYTKLLVWPYWKDAVCFTSRYRYHFAGTALGMAVQVIDLTSDQDIDVTDYADW